MPVKLPGPEVGTAEQAEPNGAEAEPALMADELVAPMVGAAPDDEVVAAADEAAGLLALLLHALALTAIAAEHSRTAAVLLGVENMISSLIQ
jgi:hypothetical protein